MSSRTFKPATTYPALVGQVIAGLREHQGLNQASLAKQMGVNASTLSRLERGEMEPSLPHLSRAARALGTTPADILAKADLAQRDLESRGVAVESGPVRDPIGESLAMVGIGFLGLIVGAAIAASARSRKDSEEHGA